MAGDDSRQGSENPSEQRGGTTPGDAEAREKGEWAATAQDGGVPADLGGSDAPREMLDEDPQLGSDVLGRTTGSDVPATAITGAIVRKVEVFDRNGVSLGYVPVYRSMG